MENRSVCVFCSSDDNVAETLKLCTQEIGSFLGTMGLRVLTGGSEAGLMWSIAEGFLKTGHHDYPHLHQ